MESNLNLKENSNFNKIFSTKNINRHIKTAVVYPCSDIAIKGFIEPAKRGVIEPVIYGPKQRIIKIAEDINIDISKYEFIDTGESESKAAEEATLSCRDGYNKLLMKGSIHSDTFLKAILDKNTGIRTDNIISHTFILDVPTYHKILFLTDAAVNIAPDLKAKVSIVQNVINFAHSLNIDTPKVAILSAIEKINIQMKSTLDAAILCKMSDRKQITGGLLDGPLAVDNAINMEAVKIKGIESDVAGDADILVCPNIESGNMIYKSLANLSNVDCAGVLLGAQVPVILTSRADDSMTRLYSAIFASFAVKD